MKTLLIVYISAYTLVIGGMLLVYVFLVPAEDKEGDRWWTTPLDTLLFAAGLAGMLLLAMDHDWPSIKAAWKVVSPALVAVQLFLNIRGRRSTCARPEIPRIFIPAPQTSAFFSSCRRRSPSIWRTHSRAGYDEREAGRMTEKDYIDALRAACPAEGQDATLDTLHLAAEAVGAYPESAELWCLRGDLIQLGLRCPPTRWRTLSGPTSERLARPRPPKHGSRSATTTMR